MEKKLRFLFIVQGEGRGHLTQAISLADMVRRHEHEVVETLVGKSHARELPAFFHERMNTSIRIYDTPSFVFGKDRKHIDLIKTFLYNASPQKLKTYAKSIELIYSRIREVAPDIVVNFYEILPGFAQLRFRIDVPFVHIGHQYMLRHPDYMIGRGDHLMLLRLHAILCSIGATKILALSFYPMKSYPRERVVVVPPLLRKEVVDLKPSTGDYILGYMVNQGYENEIRAWHKKHPEVRLHFFWDKQDAPAVWEVDETLTLHTIDDESFLKYMAGCRGYITTAGFESVCEALYLDKPVMMIPAHIEQEVNAADAVSIHGGIVGKKFDLSVLLACMDEKRTFQAPAFQAWIHSAEKVFMEQLTSVRTGFPSGKD
ncbi:MAG: hypothetical protein LBB90_07210 [Tannerella sp.]|jgi:uncharacterized protein (TIGR00661 family)|nr:hypothetical protein [Tannerella sp.]